MKSIYTFVEYHNGYSYLLTKLGGNTGWVVRYKNRPYHINPNLKELDGNSFRNEIVKFLETNAVHTPKKFTLMKDSRKKLNKDIFLYPIQQLIDLLIFYDYQDFADYPNYFSELHIVLKKNNDELISYGTVDMIYKRLKIMNSFGETVSVTYGNVPSIIETLNSITGEYILFGIRMHKDKFDKFFEHKMV